MRGLQEPARSSPGDACTVTCVDSNLLARCECGVKGVVQSMCAFGLPDDRSAAMTDNVEGHRTASRAALEPAFVRNREQLDWMHVPGMSTYVNSMVSGKNPSEGGHWAAYAAEKHVIPLSSKLGRPVRMASLGCGASRIEKGLISTHRWPVASYLALEYDDKLRDKGREHFEELPQVRFDSAFFDFNNAKEGPEGSFDVVFAHHGIHHATDIEGLLRYVNSILSDDGIFIGSEFFGPTRFQVTREAREIIDELDARLPPELRVDLRTGKVSPVKYATLDDMKYDPSESARSADLRVILFANFPLVDVKPMGGTLLRWLFQNRAGNFDRSNQFHCAIASLLIHIERDLIRRGLLQSDDLFFVVGKSDCL